MDFESAGAAGAAGAALGLAASALGGVPTTSGRFVVDHDNVLAAAKIIQTQVDALQDRLRGSMGELRVVPPGKDVVSVRVAEEWNDRLVFADGSYVERVSDYVQGLQNLVQQLRDSALQYGYNEEEISDALGKTRA